MTIITDAAFSRRSILKGLGAALTLVAAPPLVRATSLMDIRGVPLRDNGLIRCHGQIVPEISEPGLLKALRVSAEQSPYSMNVYSDGRQYGGSLEERTFGIPDFRPFEAMEGMGPIFIDREANLYVDRAGERADDDAPALGDFRLKKL